MTPKEKARDLLRRYKYRPHAVLEYIYQIDKSFWQGPLLATTERFWEEVRAEVLKIGNYILV